MGDWKLLKGANDKDAEEDPTVGSADGKVALYNLATDIGEQKNLATEQPEKVKKLRSRLDAMMKTAVARGQGATQRKKRNS